MLFWGLKQTRRDYSGNHLTSKPDLSICIVYIIPNMYIPQAFILDTSSNDRMCYTKKELQSLKIINPITIILPNRYLLPIFI